MGALDYQIALWQALAPQGLQADDYPGGVRRGRGAASAGAIGARQRALKRALELHANRRLEPEMAGFMVLNELALGQRDAAQGAAGGVSVVDDHHDQCAQHGDLALLQEVEEAVARAK